MRFWIVLLVTLTSLTACKKAGDRTCLKSYGDDSEKIIALDSVNEFRLYKNLTYHVYQDTLRQIIIRGGSNMLNLVQIENDNHVLSITNKNKCHFLRKYENQVLVEIHYPFYKRFYSETNDSLIFMNNIVSPYLHIVQFQGGGGVRLNTQAGMLILSASNGVGNFHVSGTANYADLRIQTNGSGDARGLIAPIYEIDHSSTADLLLNLDTAALKVKLRGTGNVVYTGYADTVSVQKTGDGDLIHLP